MINRILKLCIFTYVPLVTFPTAQAQFTTVINVPPDAAPSSIGSDTQLNFDAGGDDLPAAFQAGLSGDANHVEVNINGGTVGNMFHAGPADGSGGDVTVNIAGGMLGNVNSHVGAEVLVSGGQLGVVTATGGNITSTAESTATIQYFGASNAGTAIFRGGAVTGGGGFEGGFLATSGASEAPKLTIDGGQIAGVNLNSTDASATAILELNGGQIAGDVNGEFANRIDFTMTGGEVTGDVRLDYAYATKVRITGGTLQNLVTGSFSDANSDFYPRVEIHGGTIASIDMTLGLAFVTYYGTQFSVDGSDVTDTLPLGVPVGMGGFDTLSGVLADGTAFFYDFPANTGTTSLVRVNGDSDGDYNGDGKVDAADYALWRDSDTTPAGYDTWKASFGSMTGSGAADAAVQEPAALILSIIAGMWGSLWIVRRRSLGREFA